MIEAVTDFSTAGAIPRMAATTGPPSAKAPTTPGQCLPSISAEVF